MEITLNDPSLQRFIAEQVSSGRFASEADAVAAGIARLMDDARDAEVFDERTRQAIARSEQQIAAGQVRDLESARRELMQKHFGTR